MGNNVGVEVNPLRMEDLLKKDQPQVEERTTFGRFNSVLRLWAFKPHEDDALFILNHPVTLLNFSGFKSEHCYILLHIYRGTVVPVTETGNSSPMKKDQPPLDLEVVRKSVNNLSPRGQAECGGNNSFSSRSGATSGGSQYEVFVWNGKSASEHIRANSLAKCYELNGSLRDGRGMYYDDGSTTGGERNLVPLYHSDPSNLIEEDWGLLMKQNLFFRTLNALYNADITPRGLASPKPSEERIKQRESVSKRRSKGKNSNSRNLKDLPKIELPGSHQHVSRSRSNASSPARSLSLPQNQIMGLKSKLGNLRLDIHSMSESGAIEEVGEPPASNNAIIARYTKVCSQISEQLFIGGDGVASDMRLLKEKGITHVLNCAGTACKDYFPDEFSDPTFFLYDGASEKISCLFYDTLEFIDDAISQGGLVFVHCHQGISRSSAMLILYLMWKEKKRFTELHEFVKSKREICNPNANFTCQLLNWWKARTEDKEKPRAFVVTPHSTEDPETLALRELALPLKFLDPQGCYIFCQADQITVWSGSDASRILRKGSRRYVKLLQRFEEMPSNVVRIKEGKPLPSLDGAFASAQHIIGPDPALQDLFTLVRSRPRKSKSRNVSESSL